jgi:hypothetical protein
MIMVVVRRDPDKGYYYTMHNRDGLPIAVSTCWPSKDDCADYLRAVLPARVRVEDASPDLSD